MKKIKIVIAGARGKMGSEAVALIEKVEHFELVAIIEKTDEAIMTSNVAIFMDAGKCFSETKPDVLIDFTTSEVGRRHIELAIENNVRPVVGTTGFTEEDLERFRQLAEEKKIGVIIAPNFAIGGILMMKFSQMAAKYFHDVDIIELHHNQKLDAPSGTAMKTAEMIVKERPIKQQGHPNEREVLIGARGANYDGIHIHSVRLPGLVAHQEVIFGGEGEGLTIRHDSYHRSSFMSGVKLSVDTVMELETLVYGLEHIIG